jgi:hypothetical protein
MWGVFESEGSHICVPVRSDDPTTLGTRISTNEGEFALITSLQVSVAPLCNRALVWHRLRANDDLISETCVMASHPFSGASHDGGL